MKIKSYQLAIGTVCVLFLGIAIGYGFNLTDVSNLASRNSSLNKELMEQREASDAYVWACEKLLDRICEDDETFFDSTAETGEFEDYMKAKKDVYVPTEVPAKLRY